MLGSVLLCLILIILNKRTKSIFLNLKLSSFFFFSILCFGIPFFDSLHFWLQWYININISNFLSGVKSIPLCNLNRHFSFLLNKKHDAIRHLHFFLCVNKDIYLHYFCFEFDKEMSVPVTRFMSSFLPVTYIYLLIQVYRKCLLGAKTKTSHLHVQHAKWLKVTTEN